METKNYFQQLNDINVGDKTEQKNGLTYLSWAWAWAEVKKIHPTANYKIYETDTGCIYWTDGRTAWVKTGVTINDIEHIEYLPVMNYSNKSIPTGDMTSFDVNKAIQRSLTKAVARHGLGLYIYAGEDLPESETESATPKPKKPTAKASESGKPTTAQLTEAAALGINLENTAKYYKRASVSELTKKDLDAVILMKKRAIAKEGSDEK